MRATTMTILALGAVLMLTQTARADEIRVRFSNGERQRWIPATTVIEERPVTVAAHYETRLVTVTEPGHFENRERRVWVPETVTYERRERCVPAFVIRHDGVRIQTSRTVCETVPVTHPGYWTTTCDRVWVEGCTHTVERQVLVAETTVCRSVACERPGRWERCEEPRGVRLSLHFGR